MLLDETGKPVPFQRVKSQAAARGRYRLSFIAELPPLGYRVYKFATGIRFDQGVGDADHGQRPRAGEWPSAARIRPGHRLHQEPEAISVMNVEVMKDVRQAGRHRGHDGYVEP